MFEPVFTPWAKIARLDRPIIVTEKIDGTNGAIGIHLNEGGSFTVYTQSRNKLITPGKNTDNAGFAGWVEANADSLIADLGEGLHFGEWWGSGIQRGYGQSEKFFSLFNTSRWDEVVFSTPNLRCVPILRTAEYFDMTTVHEALEDLETYGSYAALGYHNPEGVVVFHTHANMMFKKTLKDDDKGKGHGG